MSPTRQLDCASWTVPAPTRTHRQITIPPHMTARLQVHGIRDHGHAAMVLQHAALLDLPKVQGVRGVVQGAGPHIRQARGRLWLPQEEADREVEPGPRGQAPASAPGLPGTDERARPGRSPQTHPGLLRKAKRRPGRRHGRGGQAGHGRRIQVLVSCTPRLRPSHSPPPPPCPAPATHHHYRCTTPPPSFARDAATRHFPPIAFHSMRLHG